jgi:Ca-activated chloride channel family protein
LNLQFQYPEAFYLLGLVPFFILLYILYTRWKRRKMQKIGDPRLIQSLIANHAPFKTTLRFVMLVLAFVLGCLALANPRVQDESTSEQRKGMDLVLALDVSNSMLATDIQPNRLSRARLFMNKLIDNLKDDRIGLVLFAGKSYVQMPLTFDQAAAKMYVSTAGPGTVNVQGTSIADALEKSLTAFGEESERFKSIVLITDGESHDDDAVTKAQELAGQGIMINTIGIGSPEGSVIEDTTTKSPKKDPSGQVVVSRLNEELLLNLAKATNGTYMRLESSDDAVRQILSQFSGIEKKALGDASLFTYRSFYSWLVIPMLLLAVVELFIGDRKKVKA